ncbi:MAG: tripartite tricarboxylate transporter substrate binding protein [Pigmentiphaga sp.]|nr:tripartite tricarboxylate transporter substrate binding protein [Pigmentiphaga sp.]
MTHLRKYLAATAAAAILGVGSAAQAFPDQPITIVVPFPPGGSTDLLARKLGDEMSKRLNTTVIIDNRPGAGGTIGSRQVANAKPDGHTLVLGVTGSHSVSYSLYADPPYDPVKDFEAVSLVVNTPLVVAVNDQVPVKNIREFLDYARAHPDTLTYGTPGNGTSMHLTGEMLDLAAGTKLVHVPYKGSAAALNDMLGGQIDFMFGDVLVLMPHLQSGKAKALAVTGLQRHPMLPDVPTLAESGVKDFEALSWQGLFAPAGTPQPVVDKLNSTVVEILNDPAVASFFSDQGAMVDTRSPKESADFVAAETAKWADIVKKAEVPVN